MEGYVHSTESMGTVDGPGIRFVVFLQGCPMRCQYCHNPDTWEPKVGTRMTTDEIIGMCERYRPYLKNGGLTVTGGEPLLQMDFVIELFTKAKEKNIHTCLDTSGVLFQPDNEMEMEQFDHLTKVTDLVMLDIKHVDSVAHLKLTGHDNKRILSFADYLCKKDVPMWIRHVVVPGITDSEEELTKLGYLLADFHNLKAIDILPYHTLGKSKYERLGIPYPLDGVEALSKEDAVRARNIVIEGIRQKRQK